MFSTFLYYFKTKKSNLRFKSKRSLLKINVTKKTTIEKQQDFLMSDEL